MRSRSATIASALTSKSGRRSLAQAMAVPISGGLQPIDTCETCSLFGFPEACEARDSLNCWVDDGLFVVWYEKSWR